MNRLEGQGVSPGTATGVVRFLTPARREAAFQAGQDAQTEISRFRQAQTEAAAQLNELATQMKARSDEAAAALFETHALLAADEDLTDRVGEILRKTRCTAEYAAGQAGREFAARFEQLDNAYMRERAMDVRDVVRRISNILTGSAERSVHTDGPVILAADELSPSETVKLQRGSVLAFITRGGSVSSHTAILARSMGIPAVCGLGDALKADFDGMQACVDGSTGQVIFAPDENTLARFEKQRAQERARLHQLNDLRGKDSVTPDGRRIDILCNIASPDDLPEVLKNDGQGIGLFRSEFLYLAASDFPDEETQLNAYRSVAQALPGKRVVVRTLDVGADKQADYFHMKKEENPALGLRGVRFSLSRPDVFKTQLRALYRASAYGNICILFPMITSLEEVRACRRLCGEVMRGLEAAHIPFNRRTETGIMIETPASVLIADELAREVDFFSVGTNDLTQYLLACDRQQSGADHLPDPRHPAILKAVRMAAEAARRAHIWIGVCGEMASDPQLVGEFLDMGMDEISVSPASVLPLRMAVRSAPPAKK